MRLITLALLACFLFPTAAAAQSKAAKKRAKSHVRLAIEFFKEGRYKNALEEMESAHKLVPMPAHIYNIARCYQELGNEYEALIHFEKYLDQGGDRVKVKRATQAVAALTPRVFGSVEVTCEPGNSRVQIEGVGEGPCPFRLDRVRSGTFKLAVRAPGHEVRRQDIQVQAGQVMRRAIKLKVQPALVNVSSEPSGALVTIDGKPVGNTPIEGYKSLAGLHEVKVELAGYRPFKSSVKMKGGEPNEITATLVKGFGLLELSSAPGGAEVQIDGKAIGVTPLDKVKVQTGEHLLEVGAMFHGGWQRTLRVEDEEQIKLHAELPSQLHAWGMIGGGVLALAGAGVAYMQAQAAIEEHGTLLSSYESSRDPTETSRLHDEIRASEDSTATSMMVATVAIGLGVALSAGGAVLILTAAPDTGDEGSKGVGEASIALRGSW